MKTLHTPGPWTAGGDLVSGGLYVPANPKAHPHAFEIAKLTWTDRGYDWIPSGDTREANLRLIVAAPDLLAALLECKLALVAQMATCHPSNTIFWGERHGRAIAAIDRATGQS